jgi:ABC-type polysaccharide/polyol phosphate export permease
MSLRDRLKQSLIAQLVVRDFRSRYSGTALGVFWSLIQPLAMMGVLYLVFNYGLRVGDASDPLFVPWLFIGMVCWNFFSDAVSTVTGSFHEYAFLVKKIKFPLHIIPVVKLLTSVLMHMLFLIIVLLITVSYGLKPNIYWLQLPVFTAILAFLALGIGLITSALNVFARDISQLVSVILQFTFWATPVVWAADRVPDKFHWILNLNPVCGALSAYRAALMSNQWYFLTEPLECLRVVLMTALFLAVGLVVHKKLRPHFADVL